jgi:cytidylate kinase
LPIAIAIDGPASSGKGTIARKVAEILHYHHVDTGAMYRAVALFARRAGCSWEDREGVAAVARSLAFTFPLIGGSVHTVVNGEDVSAEIRGEEIGKGASKVASIPAVRLALLQAQRDLGERGGVVMDGRDIGTVVLPSAQLKIYLDAALEERARRRALELGKELAEVRTELADRDQRDMSRAVAPLTCAADAVRLDTTGITIEMVVLQVLELAQSRGA